jgi:hypothetical protein
MANIKVAVINACSVLTDAQVQPVVPVLQTQVHKDFAPAWGVDADLAFVPKGSKLPADSWWLAILDNSDVAGALGYHDVTSQGLPLGKVFAATDMQYHLQWTVTASHELLEMLADPEINLTVFVQPNARTGVLYAYEVCDACEADELGYKIDNTLVSDFVYPAWFESFRKPKSTQFDYGKHIHKPFQLLPGGYIGEFDVTSGSGWQPKFGEGGPYRYDKMRPRVGSRRERRRTPRDQWRESTV